MTPLSLFAPRPDPDAPTRIASAPGRTHRRDPESSHDAAERMREPWADTERGRVLALLRKFPGLTGAELADLTRLRTAWEGRALDRYAIRAHLDNLRKGGWAEVVPMGMRYCEIRGGLAQVWRATR